MSLRQDFDPISPLVALDWDLEPRSPVMCGGWQRCVLARGLSGLGSTGLTNTDDGELSGRPPSPKTPICPVLEAERSEDC